MFIDQVCVKLCWADCKVWNNNQIAFSGYVNSNSLNMSTLQNLLTITKYEILLVITKVFTVQADKLILPCNKTQCKEQSISDDI